MRERNDITLEGDTGGWQDKNGFESKPIFERPNIHLAIKFYGSLFSFFFFTSLFASYYGYGNRIAYLFLVTVPLWLLLLPILLLINAESGDFHQELLRYKDSLHVSEPSSPTQRQVEELIDSRVVVSDWEIAMELDCSISDARSRLSHMEPNGK